MAYGDQIFEDCMNFLWYRKAGKRWYSEQLIKILNISTANPFQSEHPGNESDVN